LSFDFSIAMFLHHAGRSGGGLEEVIDLNSQAARSVGIARECLSPEADGRRPAPAFLYGPDQAKFLAEYDQQQISWPVSLYTVPGATVIGPLPDLGLVILKKQARLTCDELYLAGNSDQARDLIRGAHIAMSRGQIWPRLVPGQSVLLATTGYPIYGHWLADFLPKLFVLKAAGLDIDKLRFLIPPSRSGTALLQLLGIGAEQLLPYHPGQEMLLAEELLVPTLLRSWTGATPLLRPALEFLNDRIDRTNPDLGAGPERRIFVSRSKSQRHGRTLLNTAEIEAIATSRGFTLIYPEQQAMHEQISMFRGAREILGQYGSALHASLFSPTAVTMGCLQGNGAASAGTLQSGIGEARGQKTGYILGEQQPMPAPFTGFHIDPHDFKACLKDHFA
jgi:capsular polysaccharide biosynthesis protein